MTTARIMIPYPVASQLLHACRKDTFLRIGLRWAKVPDVTTRRLVFATVAVFVLQIALSSLFHFCSPSTDAQSIFLALIQLAARVIVACTVISSVFKTHFLRACQAWLPTLLAPIITVALGFFALRPVLCEAFVASTNSMAPTLVGNHCRGACPECGQPSYNFLIYTGLRYPEAVPQGMPAG